MSATQAAKVIAKFGGAYKLAALLGLAPSSVYRWDYPVSAGGCDGLVPGPQLRKILELAPRMVPPVSILPQDLYPAAS